MTDYLFASTAAAGHLEPALPIVRALVEDGHDVRVTTSPAYADRVLATGARFVPAPQDGFSTTDALIDRFSERARLKGPRLIRFDLVHFFTRPAGAQARHLLAEAAREPTDVIVADTGLVGAWLAREAGGPPLAIYGVSVFPYASRDVAPFGLALRPPTNGLQRLRNRVLDGALRRLVAGPSAAELDRQRATLGLPPRQATVLEWNDAADLYVQLAPAGLDYPRSDTPAVVHAVGTPPPLPTAWTPPTWWTERRSSRPLVAVTQGTVATDPGHLLRAAVAGLADVDVDVVVVTGGADPSVLGPLPANARVATFVPYAELLAAADVFVTNGGFGGVAQAVAHGVPLVVAGRTEDKAEVAARVAWSGVGLDLRTERPSPAAVAAAVRTLLADPSYVARARTLSTTAPPERAVPRSVELLEQLAATGRPVVADVAAADASRG